jgi:protein phosphatase 2C family protein 2/3
LLINADQSESNVSAFSSPGTTAVTVLVDHVEKVFYLGNLGDSRAVASVNGDACAISNDHKPSKKGSIL